ncbi:hypothetical protein GGR52DRAFT_575525 [Hypoxylon sp. FL1284]|nr:hypothetical protein GGR52DRAFT_575525 [Hypoxylon sp. FL1284]
MLRLTLNRRGLKQILRTQEIGAKAIRSEEPETGLVQKLHGGFDPARWTLGGQAYSGLILGGQACSVLILGDTDTDTERRSGNMALDMSDYEFFSSTFHSTVSESRQHFGQQYKLIRHGPLTGLILGELVYSFFHRHSILPTRSPELNRTRHGSSESQESTSSKSGDATSNESSRGAHGKRKWSESEQQNSGDGNNGEDDERRPAKKRILHSPPEGCPTFWACPFSKWKPLSYQKCCQYILKDVSRLKQHLRRYHARPLYCPVCWEIFGDQDGFESHVQERSCPPQMKRDIEGVTSSQQK